MVLINGRPVEMETREYHILCFHAQGVSDEEISARLGVRASEVKRVLKSRFLARLFKQAADNQAE